LKETKERTISRGNKQPKRKSREFIFNEIFIVKELKKCLASQLREEENTRKRRNSGGGGENTGWKTGGGRGGRVRNVVGGQLGGRLLPTVKGEIIGTTIKKKKTRKKGNRGAGGGEPTTKKRPKRRQSLWENIGNRVPPVSCPKRRNWQNSEGKAK